MATIACWPSSATSPNARTPSARFTRATSQKTLNALLRLALADLGLDELLHRALALVLHSPWPLAKRLVEAHAGRIRIECPPGGGTVVTIELPRSVTR
jgi:hypothetical protein